MGYSIYIGNGEMEARDDDDDPTEFSRVINGKTVYFNPVVQWMKRDDAPNLPNDVTENSNHRSPGYSAWREFCEMTGLGELFFDNEEGLMRESSGFQVLTKEHSITITQALESWKANHPNAIPGFDPFYAWNEEPVSTGNDPILARLIWLEYWVRWAVLHCENAGIYNF